MSTAHRVTGSRLRCHQERYPITPILIDPIAATATATDTGFWMKMAQTTVMQANVRTVV